MAKRDSEKNSPTERGMNPSLYWKKQTPTERLEEDNPKYERLYIKTPGKIYDSTLISEKDRVAPDYRFIKSMLQDMPRKNYAEIHNHRYTKDIRENGKGSIPSDHDFCNFLFDDNIRTMEIFQQNPEEKEIGGWYFVKKTRKTPRSGFKRTDLPNDSEELKVIIKDNLYVKQLQDDIYDYRKKAFGIMGVVKKSPEERQEAMEEIARKYRLKIRFVPNKKRGYEYRTGTGFLKQNDRLESLASQGHSHISAAFISVLLLIIGLLFSFSNITGFAINNLSVNNYNFVGLIFLIIGLIVGVYYLKN